MCYVNKWKRIEHTKRIKLIKIRGVIWNNWKGYKDNNFNVIVIVMGKGHLGHLSLSK